MIDLDQIFAAAEAALNECGPDPLERAGYCLLKRLRLEWTTTNIEDAATFCELQLWFRRAIRHEQRDEYVLRPLASGTKSAAERRILPRLPDDGDGWPAF